VARAAVLTGLLVLGGAGTALPAGAQDAVTGPDGPVADAISAPGELDTLAEVRELADETVGDGGVTVGVVVDTNGVAPGGISVERIVAPVEQVAPLTAAVDDVPGVASAAVDVPVRLLVDPLTSRQYAIPRVGAGSVRADQDGLGTVVAVLDTGVAADHPDLVTPLRDGSRRVLDGTSFLYGDPANGTPGTTDPQGHGTHVAGIISAARDNGVGGSGVAPGATVLPVRVMNARGTGYSSDVAAGIRWAHQQGADVINMSLGAAGGEFPADVARAIDVATTTTAPGATAPTVVVASAGNDGPTGAAGWPARHPRAIAVAATDSLDRVASFSTRGDYVDVAAPGVAVLSTCRTGGWCSMSGTSMAAPVVAAAAAVLRQAEPTRSPAGIEALLEQTAVDLGTPGADLDSGAGRINLAAALAADPGSAPSAGAGTPNDSAPAAAPVVRAPVRLTGAVDTTVVDRRRYRFGGWAADPDATPLVRISVVGGGRVSFVDPPVTAGRWERTLDLSAGTNLVCAVGYDQPSMEPVVLGCRTVTVK
jgi:subtilisin family serine protease